MDFIKKIVIACLAFESKLVVRKYKPFVVAVTGSVGKTTTKDAIYSVLKDNFRYVRKSEKSLNSEIGLPLTILGLPNAWHSPAGWLSNMMKGLRSVFLRSDYPDCLVLELGADHPGDIRKVVKWLRPDIAVLTKVSSTPVHVEFFKSPEQVFEEKASLAMAVKDGGTVALYADDDKVLSIADRLKDRKVNVVTYGGNASAMVRAVETVTVYDDTGAPTGMRVSVSLGGEQGDVMVGHALGDAYRYPVLAAMAVGRAKGMDLPQMTKALSSFEVPKGRMNAIQGVNGSTVIDDVYNSSPDAAASALSSLGSLRCSGIKIAVLGDMMELGKFSADEHRKIGKLAASVVGKLYTVGPRSKMTAEEAVKCGLPQDSVQSFDDSRQAAAAIAPTVKAGDIVLVKGSQSMRMERVTVALLRDPARAAELTVRQEKEWLEKA